jgi:hypothetical protein
MLALNNLNRVSPKKNSAFCIKSVAERHAAGLAKTRVFFKKTQPGGFFWVLLGFIGFLGFFGFF